MKFLPRSLVKMPSWSEGEIHANLLYSINLLLSWATFFFLFFIIIDRGSERRSHSRGKIRTFAPYTQSASYKSHTNWFYIFFLKFNNWMKKMSINFSLFLHFLIGISFRSTNFDFFALFYDPLHSFIKVSN